MRSLLSKYLRPARQPGLKVETLFCFVCLFSLKKCRAGVCREGRSEMFNSVTLAQEEDSSDYYNLAEEQKQSRPSIHQTTRNTHPGLTSDVQWNLEATSKRREVATFDCRSHCHCGKPSVRSRNLRKGKYLSTPSKKFATTVNWMGRRNFTPHNTPREQIRVASNTAIYVRWPSLLST